MRIEFIIFCSISVIILIWKSLPDSTIFPKNIEGKLIPEIKWGDKRWRTLIVLLLWGVFNLSLWAIIPFLWENWYDMGHAFFLGTQGTIIIILILEVVFKTKDNTPVITRMRQALIILVILGFVNQFNGFEKIHDWWTTPTKHVKTVTHPTKLVLDTIIAPVGKLSRGFVVNYETTTIPSDVVEVVVFRNGKFVKKFIDTPGVKNTVSIKRGDILYFISVTKQPVQVALVKL